jgi:transcription elongation factor GreA
MAKRLRHAVQQGDLSENADYITAKEAQAFLEGRILELETILREAVIVENGGGDVVGVGSTVVVSVDGGKDETFQVVGVAEAKPREGKISHESPIGQALIGHRVGDQVKAATPGGSIELRIVQIR